MRKGAYSDKFKALEDEVIKTTLKKENKSAAKEKEKRIIRETNKRRRYLALKRKALEDVEKEKRQKVLAARKQKQLEATNKFQRNQKLKTKKDVKESKPGRYSLRDGLYNIRGHIVEIKGGMRVNGMPNAVDHRSVKGNSLSHEQKTVDSSSKNSINANKNTVYSGKSYLLHHLNDLVNGQEKKHRDEAENPNETSKNHGNKKRLEPEGSMSEANLVDTNRMVNNSDDLKASPDDASVSSSDSLELVSDPSRQKSARRTPKSNLRNRGSSVNSDKEKRKVKFNNSIEFNDGFVWMLKDNEQKPSNSFESKTSIIPSENRSRTMIITEEQTKSSSRDNNHGTTSFSPALPRYDDYSYPDSVDLSSPSTMSFAKRTSNEKKVSTPEVKDLNIIVHNDSVSDNSFDFSPTDSLELANEETTELDVNDDTLHQRIISNTDATNTLHVRDSEIRKHASGYPNDNQGFKNRNVPSEEKDRDIKDVPVQLEKPYLTNQAAGEASTLYSNKNNSYLEGVGVSSRESTLGAGLGNNHTSGNYNYETQAQNPYSLKYSNAGINHHDKQSHFKHEVVQQLQHNEVPYPPHHSAMQSKQEPPSQAGELDIYRHADKNFVSSYNPRPAYNAASIQSHNQTVFDSNSFLHVRGDSYFPNRPSLEESNGSGVNYHCGPTEYAKEHPKYQNSPQTVYVDHQTSTAATSSLHRDYAFNSSDIHKTDFDKSSMVYNENVSDRNHRTESEHPRKATAGYKACRTEKETFETTDNTKKVYNTNKPFNIPRDPVQPRVPFKAVSAIDLEHVMQIKTGSKNDIKDDDGDDDDDDEIINNVRKSMAELKFSTKWEPSVNSGKGEELNRAEEIKDNVEIGRPTVKTKLIEQDLWVNDTDVVKKQSKIEDARRSNIPLRTPSSSDKNISTERKISTGKTTQKPGLVPHPPPGPRGRLFPRKRPPSDVVRKRGSPMKVVNPNKITQNEAINEEKLNNVSAKVNNNGAYPSHSNGDKYANYDKYVNNNDYANYDSNANYANGKGDNGRVFNDVQTNVEDWRNHLKPNDNQYDKNTKLNVSDKTPTDDEINELWYDVQSCLKTKQSHKASSDTVYISSPWRQQRTWSGSRNMNTRQGGPGLNNRGQNSDLSLNRLGSTLPMRRYGSHENLRRENSLDNLTGNVRIRGRSAMTLRNQRVKITPNVQAFSLRKSSTIPDPVNSNQAPMNSKSRHNDASESLSSFLALEAMCQQESLSPYHTSAILKASQNAHKGMKNDQRRENESPLFFNESRRQEPSALSIEERKVMESLERLNSRLREKEAENDKRGAVKKWNDSLLTNGYSTASAQSMVRRTESGSSPSLNNRNTRGNSHRQGKYKS